MGDSLLIDNSIQIMEGPGGTPSTDPRCTGAVFQITPGYDFGAPQPIAAIVASLLVDGERPLGRRASNRTMIIPVQISAPNRIALAGAKEVILQTVDQQAFDMTWTREDTGLNAIIKCFRQQAPVPTYDIKSERMCVQVITLTIPALPFLRSDTPEVLTFAASAGGAPAPPSPVTLDSYTTVSGTNWSAQSSGSINGNCAHYTHPSGTAPASYTSVFSAVDISALTSLTHYIGIAESGSYWSYYGGFDPGSLAVAYTLTDNAAHTITFGTSFYVSESFNTSAPNWNQVTLAIPQGVAGFVYTALTKVQVSITNYRGSQLVNTDVYLDELVASPSTSTKPVISTRGAVYGLNIKGTAHAPLNFQVAPASGSINNFLLHRPGPDAPAALTPFVAITNPATDLPDGRWYPVQSLITNQNARFSGTYSVLVSNFTWAATGSVRAIQVNIGQYEYSGDTLTASKEASVSRSVTPSIDAVNGFVFIGEITLPVNDIPPDNTDAQFAAGITSGQTGDRFYDIILLDTMGQTIFVNMPGTGYPDFFIDEPDSTKDIGRILGSENGTRGRATSVMQWALPVGVLTADPGSNLLLVYSNQGAPGIISSYDPTWWMDIPGPAWL